MGWIRRLFRRQKLRRDVSAFIDNPSVDLAVPPYAVVGGARGAPFTLPANITLYCRSASGTSSNQPAIEVSGVVIYAPPLDAGQVYSLGWHEEEQVVTPQAGFEILIDVGLGNYQPIGAGGVTQQLAEIFRLNPTLPGAWFDCADMSTMFQDAAGTTPVTALGQPVGLHLDISGRGNHRSQVTTARRPIYSARVNQFSSSVNLAPLVGVTVEAGNTDPFGENFAFKIVGNAGNGPHATANGTPAVFAGQWLTASAYFKAGEYGGVQMNYAGACVANFNLRTATVNSVAPNSGVLSGVTAKIEPVPGQPDWLRAQVTFQRLSPLSASTARFYLLPSDDFTAIGVPTFEGDGSSGIFAAGFQLETGWESKEAGPYQKITSPVSYTDVGAKRYLQYDGVDDWLSIPTYDITPNFALFTAFRSERNAGQHSSAALVPVAYPGLMRIMNPNIANAVSVMTFAGANNGGAGYVDQEGAWTDRFGKNTVVGHVTNWVDMSINRCAGDERISTLSQGAALPAGHTKVVSFGSMSGAAPMQGREYGAVILNKFLTPEEIAIFESWLSAQYGGGE